MAKTTTVKETKKTTKKNVKKEIQEVVKTAKVLKEKKETVEVQNKVPVKIKRLMAKVDELQEQERKISDEKEALKDQIKLYMKEIGVKELLSDNLKAVYSESQRTTFDKDTFATKHPKMYKVYLEYCIKSDKVIESLKVSNITKTTRKK